MQFIFENPIIILFIIGMVTSLLKKRKEANETQRNKEKRPHFEIPPGYDTDPVDDQTYHRSGKPTLEYIEVKPSPRKFDVNNDRVVKRAKNEDRKTAIAINEAALENANLKLTPSQSKLVDGVIWAEILGPPRAIKPHTYRRGFHRK